MVYNSLFQRLTQALLPFRCLLCLAPCGHHAQICLPCRDDLPRISSPCEQCALPLPNLTQSRFCAHCLHRTPAFSHTFCPFLYAFPVSRLIAKFKHQQQFALGHLLAQLWLEDYLQSPTRATPALLMPVPLHRQRRWTRGFNQSRLLAETWSKALDIRLHDDLYRRRDTPSQQGLSAIQRRRNLRGAFAISHPELVRGKHIALVDDVMTTGTTANALAAILLRAGATRVDIWCLARTPAPARRDQQE